ANRELVLLGVSGDGDTASIGLGQFAHMVRRNVDCTYIVEDNGTYGLTKGQFSATADVGSVQKRGAVNTYVPIDLCALAIPLGGHGGRKAPRRRPSGAEEAARARARPVRPGRRDEDHPGGPQDWNAGDRPALRGARGGGFRDAREVDREAAARPPGRGPAAQPGAGRPGDGRAGLA